MVKYNTCLIFEVRYKITISTFKNNLEKGKCDVFMRIFYKRVKKAHLFNTP